MAERRLKIYKTFEEQEMDYLRYFHSLSKQDRMKALFDLQKKQMGTQSVQNKKRIIIYKRNEHGEWT